MAIALDHLILPVNDVAGSIAFYRDVLGLQPDGEDGPFSVVRVDESLVLLLSPWGTDGNVHLAFALPPDEFAAALERIRAAEVPFGDSYHDTTNGKPPGREFGARGMGQSLYLLDPNRHLIELRCYD
jgi:catechol 2,3-dioxygenase-like lactoylglutathione lyase family enzyme